jgi:hypothetical protein
LLLEFLDKREMKLLNFALKRWGFGNSKRVKVNSLTGETRIYVLEQSVDQ